MLPTPSTSHVDTSRIYDPAEDSFLLIDTLSADTECSFLQARFSAPCPPPLVLEVGTGSGVVLAFITQFAEYIFGSPDIMAMGLDLNEYACKASLETIDQACKTVSQSHHAVLLCMMQCDLASACRPGVVDVLVFNPPYVPTPNIPLQNKPNGVKVQGPVDKLSGPADFENNSRLLELSYAGGKDGMEVTARLLEQVPVLLSSRGVAYILLCEGNKPEEVKDFIQAWGTKWAVETVSRSGKQAGWEKLQVVRIWRK